MEVFERHLRRGAEAMGIGLPADGIRRLTAHQRLLSKWVQRVNLTTVTDPEAMAERLYLDSAVVVAHLPPDARVHDVGSGAGFPGLVIKALLPQAQVTLTEARHKKVSFLRQAAREMGIGEGLEIRHQRVVPREPADGAVWDEVLSRAAFPVEAWIEVGAPMVGPGGRLWIFSGQPHGDAEDLPSLEAFRMSAAAGFEVDSEVGYRLPFTGRHRSLVALRRL
jgi:16S rRNA (guanine527-N7)-methyltransferase